MKESTFEKYKLVIDEYLVNGMNGTKAYQKFYTKATEETAKVNFSKILTIANVADYLQEQQLKTSSKLNITRESQLKDLQWVKAAAKKDKRLNDLTKAIEVQNKMLGLNEPEKLDLTSKGEQLKHQINILPPTDGD